MQLLISDANILIDMEVGGLLEGMFDLQYEFAVPDLLFEDELADQHGHFLDLGLKTLVMAPPVMDRVTALAATYRKPSRYDLMALALAEALQCPLLTGDESLRIAAQAELAAARIAQAPQFEVRGTLWLVEQMVTQLLISVDAARVAYRLMREGGRRLPWGLAEQRLNRLA